jgi:hypothetical protein
MYAPVKSSLVIAAVLVNRPDSYRCQAPSGTGTQLNCLPACLFRSLRCVREILYKAYVVCMYVPVTHSDGNAAAVAVQSLVYLCLLHVAISIT